MKFVFFFLFLNLSWAAIDAQNPDINLLRSINEGRNRSLDPAFYFLTVSTTEVAIAQPASLLVIGMIKQDKKIEAAGLTSACALLAEGIVVTGLKYAVNRPRPFTTYPDIQKIGPAGSPSFPSGHTGAAFCAAASMSFAYPKWYVIVPSFLWASAVAYSRMDLGVHYPSDVAAGAIIGTGCAWISYKIRKKLENPGTRH